MSQAPEISCPARPAPVPAEPTRLRLLVPAALALAGTLAYGLLGDQQFRNLVAPSWDLGIFTQLLRAYGEPRAPDRADQGRCGEPAGRPLPSAARGPLAPVWWIWPSGEAPLWTQAPLFGISAIPLTRLAIDRLGAGLGTVAGAAYVFSFGPQSAAAVQFHEIALAVPLLAFSLTALAREKVLAAALWAAPLVLVKEDLGLTVAALGLVIAAAWPGAPPARRPARLLGRGMVRAGDLRDPPGAEHCRAVRLHRQPRLAAGGGLAAGEVADRADAPRARRRDRSPFAADLADGADPRMALHRDGRVLLGLVLALQRGAHADRARGPAGRPRRPPHRTGHGLGCAATRRRRPGRCGPPPSRCAPRSRWCSALRCPCWTSCARSSGIRRGGPSPRRPRSRRCPTTRSSRRTSRSSPRPCPTTTCSGRMARTTASPTVCSGTGTRSPGTRCRPMTWRSGRSSGGAPSTGRCSTRAASRWPAGPEPSAGRQGGRVSSGRAGDAPQTGSSRTVPVRRPR
ncbi:DUF2079 domain-containing protein [Brachybacterium sp. GPGPB12]|uniref:DUF2079 domain-containing protein n=1 Tax=Brachybacterium sp. GPGPB12 TaxID=3023517 RepID=UPI0031342B45